MYAIVCFYQGVMMLLWAMTKKYNGDESEISHTEVPQGAARPGICNCIVCIFQHPKNREIWHSDVQAIMMMLFLWMKVKYHTQKFLREPPDQVFIILLCECVFAIVFFDQSVNKIRSSI